MTPQTLALAWTLLAPAVDPAGPRERPPEPRVDPRTVARALDRSASGPPVAQLQRAALARAHVDPRATRGWLRRVRAAALLPDLMGQADVQTDRVYVLDQEAGTADALKQDLAGGSGFRIRVSWSLDRLIFNPDELRAARAGLDVLDWRRRVVEDVTGLYFERRRLLAERLLAPPSGVPVSEALDREVRIREIESILTGLTGLEFRPAGRPAVAPPPRP